MYQETKKKILFFLVLLTIISMILSLSLSGLDLQPGLPMPEMESGKIVTNALQNEELIVFKVDDFFIFINALLLFGFLIYMIFQMGKGLSFHQLRQILLRLFVSLITISIIIVLAVSFLKQGKTAPVPDLLKVPPPPEVKAPLGVVPPLLLWTIGIGLAVLILVIVLWIFLPKKKQPATMDLVKYEAEKAYKALLSGKDLREVIIQCYQQMSLALAHENGIERQDFLTPHEFEEVLTQAGIPGLPLQQLTRLFEAVRYGNWNPNPGDEKMAIQCMEDIFQAAAELTGESG